MSSSLPPLPRDIDELTRLVCAEKAENERLRERIALLERLIFGAKSEKLVSLLAEQGLLDLGDLTAVASPPKAANDEEVATPPGKKRKTGPASRNIGALPAHLPRIEEVIEPESTTCPCCSGPMHRIGEPAVFIAGRENGWRSSIIVVDSGC